jgi:hypothetical protein
MTSECLKAEQKSDVPPPPPLPPNMVEPAEENAKERQTHQPLATISIQDLNSVQLRRTVAGKTMSVPLNVPGKILELSGVKLGNANIVMKEIESVGCF